nr:response regulator transcription factor [uncultured Cellulosilyticum sp.]
MRLLVIEDEIGILEALRKGLQREGYAVDIVSDGYEAMEYLELNTYDLVVLDINLPGIDGFSILQELRKRNMDTRVIIVSANREIEDRVRGLDLGANDYLVKPFDFQELKARIRGLLRRKFVSEPNNLKYDGIEINLSSHKVTYNGEEIQLTLKEYGILKYLIQNKGRAVSSEELFEHVWDEHSDPFSKVIRVHIYSLRKKLIHATGEKEIITTLKGVGYLLKGDSHE